MIVANCSEGNKEGDALPEERQKGIVDESGSLTKPLDSYGRAQFYLKVICPFSRREITSSLRF
jgi:hypothetical protein